LQEQVITCPHCKKEILLTEAITHQIRENLRAELEAKDKKSKNRGSGLVFCPNVI